MKTSDINHAKQVLNSIKDAVMEHANMVGIGSHNGQLVIKIGFATEQDQEASSFKDGSSVNGVLIKTEIIGTIRAL